MSTKPISNVWPIWYVRKNQMLKIQRIQMKIATNGTFGDVRMHASTWELYFHLMLCSIRWAFVCVCVILSRLQSFYLIAHDLHDYNHVYPMRSLSPVYLAKSQHTNLHRTLCAELKNSQKMQASTWKEKNRKNTK